MFQPASQRIHSALGTEGDEQLMEALTKFLDNFPKLFGVLLDNPERLLEA